METPGRGPGCSGHLEARTACEGGTGAEGQVAPAQVGSRRPGDWADVRAISATAVGRAMRGAFRGVRWIWVPGRKKGERMAGFQSVPATSRVSRNVPRPGLVSTPRAVPGSPSPARERLALLEGRPAPRGDWAGPGDAAGLPVSRGAVWSAPLSSPREVGPRDAVCRRMTGGGKGRRVWRAGHPGASGAVWPLAQAKAVLWSATQRRTGRAVCAARRAAGGM